MSFIPASEGINTPLVGVAGQYRILNENIYARNVGIRSKTPKIGDKRAYSSRPIESSHNNMHLLLIIIITVIIFVTAVALFDVLRGILNYYYSNIALNDPNSNNKPEEIQRTEIADYYSLLSTIVFALISIFISILLLPLLFYLLNQNISIK